jgi:RAB6A-GEF complex partner protein 2
MWAVKTYKEPYSLQDLDQQLAMDAQPASKYIPEELMGAMMGTHHVSTSSFFRVFYLTIFTASEAPALEGANFQGAQKVETMNHTDSESAEPAEPASNLRSESRRHSLFPQAFRFPNVHGRPAAVWSGGHSNTNANPRATEEVQHAERDATLESPNSLSLASKVLTGTSVTGSNRSSGDFHSPNNRSQETLVSEQASIVPDRHRYSSPLIRQHYRMASTSKPKRTSETLLMGYAQVNATFTLDGALVDQTPFEEVKRKGFLGGQGGGGVVGVATPSNPGGLLGGFSLNSIGESIGGFLGGGESSSLKEMKGVTSSRAIPLLSTPQSLLFVDLTLVPGEEKSFSFRYTLPKGLPASYKGKSIKIVYNLNIGIQGAPGEKAVHAVRRVNIPFKVFSGVNDDGEIFGHDLMQPYVILQDNAEIDTVESVYAFPELASNIPGKNAEAATQDFLTYVDTLLNKRRRRQSSSATLEPPRGLIRNDGSSRAKQAIDRAILLSKQHLSSTQSPNRFEIARNGKRIATIVLDRTLYQLGETVTAAVDLSSPKMPCYSLRSTLETTEKVNPALALRSAASITRLSRKVYRSQSENTLFAERLVFSPSIPITATPTMMTSGVNLDWALRFEFVTTRVADSLGDKEQPVEKSLLESIVKDDRGSILAAVETLQCETFEISIPITVYGDTIVTGTEGEETSGIPV